MNSVFDSISGYKQTFSLQNSVFYSHRPLQEDFKALFPVAPYSQENELISLPLIPLTQENKSFLLCLANSSPTMTKEFLEAFRSSQ